MLVPLNYWNSTYQLNFRDLHYSKPKPTQKRPSPLEFCQSILYFRQVAAGPVLVSLYMYQAKPFPTNGVCLELSFA